MDVNEFIEKFRSVFEPKPKPVAVPKPASPPPTVVLVTPPRPIHTQILREVHPKEFWAETVESWESGTGKIQQTLPNIILEKLRPAIPSL